MLAQVPPELVGAVWHGIERHVSGAVDASRGEASAKGLYDQAASGALQLWVVIDGHEIICAAFFRLIRWDNGELILKPVALGGERVDAIVAHMPEIERLAKANGVTRIQWTSRPGWEAKFPDYRRVYTTLEKTL